MNTTGHSIHNSKHNGLYLFSWNFPHSNVVDGFWRTSSLISPTNKTQALRDQGIWVDIEPIYLSSDLENIALDVYTDVVELVNGHAEAETTVLCLLVVEANGL